MKQMAEFEKSSPRKPKDKAGIKAIPKLDDANFAGGPRSSECTLIITEGDSAKVNISFTASIHSIRLSSLSLSLRLSFVVFIT